jgi:hypothetical protein
MVDASDKLRLIESRAKQIEKELSEIYPEKNQDQTNTMQNEAHKGRLTKQEKEHNKKEMKIQLNTEIGHRSAFKFTYCPDMISFIKSCDKYYFDSTQKYWTLNREYVEKVHQKAEKEGFIVQYIDFIDESPLYKKNTLVIYIEQCGTLDESINKALRESKYTVFDLNNCEGSLYKTMDSFKNYLVSKKNTNYFIYSEKHSIFKYYGRLVELIDYFYYNHFFIAYAFEKSHFNIDD